jgi:hypothetical protein
MTRRKPTRPTKRHLAKAIKVLVEIAENPETPDYVRAKSANALLAAGSRADADMPERDPASPGTRIFLPRKDRHPDQREGESAIEWSDRIKVKSEARRACYCESLGLPYDPMRPLPCWPWPTPGSNPELEDEVDRRVAEAEAVEIERQRANPRPEPVEVLGPREDHPGVIIFDPRTEAGRADYRRWRADAVAQGHAIIEPQ